MKTILSSETMDVPDGVDIKINAKIIEVECPRGKLTRNFKHLNLDFQLIKDEETGVRRLKIDPWFGSRKTSAAIRNINNNLKKNPTNVKKKIKKRKLQKGDRGAMKHSDMILTDHRNSSSFFSSLGFLRRNLEGSPIAGSSCPLPIFLLVALGVISYSLWQKERTC